MTLATKALPPRSRSGHRPRHPRPPAASGRPLHPVTAYARAVVDGKIVAGQLVKLACRRHLRDLRKPQRPGGRRLVFDEDAASDAIAFFSHLRQSKGRWAGKPLELRPWQSFVVGCVFGWKWASSRGHAGESAGLRRFRTAYVSVARKNGKTTLAAGVALYLLDFDNEPGAEIHNLGRRIA